MKTIIAGIGFVMMMVGASCDIEKSDMRAVAVLVLVGCFFMWIGGKDYECETEAAQKKNRICRELDVGYCSSSLADRITDFLFEIKRNRRTRGNCNRRNL